MRGIGLFKQDPKESSFYLHGKGKIVSDDEGCFVAEGEWENGKLITGILEVV